MGKHAQYGKRGSSTGTGFLPAPLAADWTVGIPSDTDVLITLLVSIPAGADRWGVMAIRTTTNIPVPVNVSTGSTVLVTPLTPSSNYRLVAAWFSSASNIQVSAWSPFKIVLTAT
jgi:hypothetical protein